MRPFSWSAYSVPPPAKCNPVHYVFPTPVEVFLTELTSNPLQFNLLHARGGVSTAAQTAIDKLLQLASLNTSR